MFFNLDCLLGSMPTLLSLSDVTDDDLRSLLGYLEGNEVTPANSGQAFLFRVIDDMNAKDASPDDYGDVQNLIERRLAGEELVREVVEYDDEDEYFDYDDAA